MTTVVPNANFIWRGLALHWGRRTKPVLTLVADETYPHLYRIRYPDGWMSPPANLTSAKDAAYDHARHLLVGQSRVEASHTAGEPELAVTMPPEASEAA